MATSLAVLGVIVLLLSARSFPSARLTRVVVPVTGLCATIAIGSRLARKHPEEPWLARWLVLAVIAKMIASVLRYRTIGTEGDAQNYDMWGARYSNMWLHHTGDVVTRLDDIRKTNFVRWFTGIVYYLFGQDMVAGFLVFALIAFVGSYLWYRAAAEALRSVTGHRLLPRYELREEDEEDANGSTLSGEELVRRFIEEFDAEEILEEEG